MASPLRCSSAQQRQRSEGACRRPRRLLPFLHSNSSLTLRAQGSVAYGMLSTTGGALSMVTSVAEGWGRHSSFELPVLKGPRPDFRKVRVKHAQREERRALDDDALAGLADLSRYTR